MELSNCPVSKLFPVIPHIAVWSVPKITFANGNLAIDGRCKDLNKFKELLEVEII